MMEKIEEITEIWIKLKHRPKIQKMGKKEGKE